MKRFHLLITIACLHACPCAASELQIIATPSPLSSDSPGVLVFIPPDDTCLTYGLPLPDDLWLADKREGETLTLSLEAPDTGSSSCLGVALSYSLTAEALSSKRIRVEHCSFGILPPPLLQPGTRCRVQKEFFVSPTVFLSGFDPDSKVIPQTTGWGNK